MTLHIAPDLGLPDEYVTKCSAILAQRRKGKTYTASVLAEEMVDAGHPFVALDPTGAWWGLRASADGQGPGLPVVVLGGDHGDVPLDRTDGKGVAELVVDEPGWYVIDFGLFESNAAEVQFATDFASRLYRRKGQPNSDFPLHLFVDEADRFVPQKPSREKGEGSVTNMLGAFEAIVRRGGLRGLGTTLISQRSAVVNKNVLEQADIFIVLRVVGPNDRKRIEEIVSANGTSEQLAEMRSSIASLDLGEAWVWEPGEELFQRVRVRERRTFNSSATPKPGEKRVEPRQLAAVDLEAIKERWSDQLERAKAEDPKELRKRIRDLERQLAERPVETETVEVEREVVPAALHDDLVDARRILSEGAARYEDAAAGLRALVDRIADPERWKPTAPRPVPEVARASTRTAPALAQRPQRAPRREPTTDLPKGEGRILTAIAQYPDGVTREQLTVLTGYKRSSRDTYLQRLRERGCIDTAGATIRVTGDGLDALGDDFEPLPTGAALRDHWLAELPEGERRILAELLDAYPAGVPRDDLSERTGYKRSSRDTYLQRLRARQLVTTNGDPRAADVLFEGG